MAVHKLIFIVLGSLASRRTERRHNKLIGQALRESRSLPARVGSPRDISPHSLTFSHSVALVKEKTFYVTVGYL